MLQPSALPFKMTESYYDVYDGSKLFQSVSDSTGLPIDLVNFLIAQLAALCLARLFRKSLKFASPEFRHFVCLLIGLVMGYFCFGKQAIHLAVLPMLCYIVLRMVNTEIMGTLVLIVSLLYLSCIHLHRQMYHTADYSLDITGPLMVITQRVTSLSYSLHDSFTSSADESPKLLGSADDKIDKTPTPLEFFAYTLAFQTLMCGPVVFYTDYINFIQGTQHGLEVERKEREVIVVEPSPRLAVIYKVAGSVAAALLYLSLVKKFSITLLGDLMDPMSEVSRTWSTMYLLWYAYLATLVVRCKYYHAWLLADAICNNSGMGFNGYDQGGNPKWDKVSNIDVMGFEFAQNFRTAIASWNKNTNSWLRTVAYERGGAAWRTVRVYGLSAVWHGFQPGYYLTFLAGGLFTVSARKVRVVIRPLCMGGRVQKMLYDLVSFITTRVCMTYATVPFVLLHLQPSHAFYGQLYYSLHLFALGALLLPNKRQDKMTVQTGQILELPNGASISNGDTQSQPDDGSNSNGKLKLP